MMYSVLDIYFAEIEISRRFSSCHQEASEPKQGGYLTQKTKLEHYFQPY